MRRDSTHRAARAVADASISRGPATYRVLVAVAAAALLCALPAFGQIERVRAASLQPGSCVDGAPRAVLVVDSSASSTCSPSSTGTAEALCCCLDGTWAACASGGSAANSFETIVVPTGTSPVADSPTDTLTITQAGTVGGINIVGDASSDLITLSLLECEGGEILKMDTGSWACAEDDDSGGGGQERLPSLANPPSTPHAYDCEFDNGVTGCTGWSLAPNGEAEFTSGTVQPLASLTDPIYDYTSWPGWLLAQSDEQSAANYALARRSSVTLDTDALLIFRAFALGGTNVTTEGRIAVCLHNASDTNEGVCYNLTTVGGTERLEIYCNNDGSITGVNITNAPATGFNDSVFVLHKISDTYYGYYFNPEGGGMLSSAGIQNFSCTKTGVTTLDRIDVLFSTANETPSRFVGIDFVRYLATNGLPPLNP